MLITCARPAIVSTLPLNPEGSFGGLTGSADRAPVALLRYTCHCVLNIFWAVPIVIVATTRRWNSSMVVETLYFENAPLTSLRREDEAPYVLCTVDSDGYFP